MMSAILNKGWKEEFVVDTTQNHCHIRYKMLQPKLLPNSSSFFFSFVRTHPERKVEYRDM